MTITRLVKLAGDAAELLPTLNTINQIIDYLESKAIVGAAPDIRSAFVSVANANTVFAPNTYVTIATIPAGFTPRTSFIRVTLTSSHSRLDAGATGELTVRVRYSSGGNLTAFTQTVLTVTSASGAAEAIIGVTPNVALDAIELQWASTLISTFAHVGGAAKQSSTVVVEETSV
jgi:hypothetical protein